MKKIYPMKKILTYLAVCLLSMSCTDLDVDVKSELTSDNFPQTEEQLVAASGSIYSEFASGYGSNYWFQSELSADGAVLPARGGNWFDGGRYKELHLHSWTKNSDIIKNTWSWLYNTINNCNRVAKLFEDAPESDAKNTTVAEVRVMRALCYYLLIDNYGGVPLIKEFGEGLKPRSSRKEVFDYIETEVLESVNYLNPANDISTYGRPNQMTAYALLAKLYLNAEVYVGQKEYDKVVEMCDQVIENESAGIVGLYSDYVKMFDYDNGPQIKEFIFAIPYDENNLHGLRSVAYWLSSYQYIYWNLNFRTSGPLRGIPEFYDLVAEDPNDQREHIWLKEEQYLLDGVTPMILPVTRIQLDSRYSGANPSEIIDYHIKYTKEIEFRNIPNFDVGDDVLGNLTGYRSNKFKANPAQLTFDQSNDFPVFRYADILLMKAEAILRGATPTRDQTALGLVNKVRERSGAAVLDMIDPDILLDERGRELCYENWRRNDLIRFGKFENSWLLKTDTDPDHRLFPIPQTEIEANPELTQNPGYETK